MLNRCPQNLLVNETCYYVIMNSKFRSGETPPAGTISISSDNGTKSIVISQGPNLYQPTFGAYEPNNVLNSCEGTQLSSRSITSCTRMSDSLSVDVSLCSDPNPSITYKSPAGQLIKPILNGSETGNCTEGSSSWVFTNRTCNSGFFDNGSGCSSVVYIPSFGPYSTNTVTTPCSGVQVGTRSIVLCMRQHDSLIVDNSLCSDPNPSTTYKSPAGSSFDSISHGQIENTCSEGSNVKTYAATLCDNGYHSNGMICDINQYIATYSYSQNNVSAICSGTEDGIKTVTTCTQLDNGQSVPLSNCSPISSVETYRSPQGNRDISVNHGTEHQSCAEGSTNWIKDSLTCDPGYYDDAGNCSQITYIAQYSDYSPNSVTNICDGTQEAFRSITSCIQSHNSNPVDISYCSDPNPSIFYYSPGGELSNFTSIAHGAEYYSCNQGQSSQYFSRRVCDSGYQDNGAACVSLAPKIVDVKLGFNYTCYFLSNGHVKCSNPVNVDGALYDGSTRLEDIAIFQNLSFSKMAMAPQNSPGIIYINSSGVPFANGLSSNNRFGSGSFSIGTFVQMTAFSALGQVSKFFISGATGAYKSCAIMANNTVRCAGNNGSGQLGNGLTSGTTSSPTLANFSTTVSNLYLGENHICALLTNNNVECVGGNVAGQIGNGNTSTQTVPVNIPAFSNPKKLVADFQNTCVLTQDNKVKCVGNNSAGWFGTGNTSNLATITEIPAWQGAVDLVLEVRSAAMCALMGDGTVKCSGSNTTGSLGNGTTSAGPLTPTTVPGLSGVVKLYGGASKFCAKTQDEKMYCWGSGESDFGMGSGSTNYLSPTEIVIN